MDYNAESPAAPKYIHIAKAMGVDTTGMSEAEGVKAAIEAVKALSISINIPQKLHEINVKEEDIPALAVAAFNDVCTGGNPCLLYTSYTGLNIGLIKTPAIGKPLPIPLATVMISGWMSLYSRLWSI